MNLFSNPIVFCGAVALGIILILILVVVICCKRSAMKEREELKSLSQEIESDFNDEFVESEEEQKIENVLSKMQEALELNEEKPVSFEQEQEENAVISYQELLDSLGAKNNIDVNSIELFDDELDNQIEISDFNKEIIDAYQNENLEREIYRFQNDYSSEALSAEVVEETPVMNFDFSSENFDLESSDESFETVVDKIELSPENVEIVDDISSEVYEARHVVSNMPKKFKRTEFISPVYGIIKEEKDNFIKNDDVEEIIFDENDSLLD